MVWNIFYFSIQLGIIIPTDFHIFQRGRAQPPTSIRYTYAPLHVAPVAHAPWPSPGGSNQASLYLSEVDEQVTASWLPPSVFGGLVQLNDANGIEIMGLYWNLMEFKSIC